MKVLVDADNKQILGAAILGTGGDEVVHGILDVMYAKAPYTVLQRTVPMHPTVSNCFRPYSAISNPCERMLL